MGLVSRGRVASAFAPVPPLCVAPQPLKTKDKKEAPCVLDNAEVEGAVPSPGGRRGGGGPAARWEWVMSHGLDLENGGSASTRSFKGVETLRKNLYHVFECLASAAARVIGESRMRALPLGKGQEYLESWDGLQKKDLKEQQEIPRYLRGCGWTSKLLFL